MGTFEDDVNKYYEKLKKGDVGKYENVNAFDKAEKVEEKRDLTQYHYTNLEYMVEKTSANYLGRLHEGGEENWKDFIQTSVDYEEKEKYYENSNDEKKIEEFSEKHKAHKKSKRVSATASAASKFKAASRKYNDVAKLQANYKELLEHEGEQSKNVNKARTKALNAELDLLDIRKQAMLKAAKAKAFEEKDENIRKMKIDMSIIAAQIASYRYYGGDSKLYSKKISKLYKEYKQAYIELEALKLGRKAKKEPYRDQANKLPRLSDEFVSHRHSVIFSFVQGEIKQILEVLIQNNKLNMTEKQQSDFNSGSYRSVAKSYINSKTRMQNFIDAANEMRQYHEQIRTMDREVVLNIAKNYVMKKVGDNKDLPQNNPVMQQLCNCFILAEQTGEKISDGLIDTVIRPLFMQSADSQLHSYIKAPDTVPQLSEQEKNNQMTQTKTFYYNGKKKKEENVNNSTLEKAEEGAKKLMLLEYRKIFMLGDSKAFLSSSVGSETSVAIQGWKMHVNASSLDDYLLTIQTLVPELIACGIHFKIAGPAVYSDVKGNGSYGKEITIYPDQRAIWSRLSPKALKLLKGEGHERRELATDTMITERLGIRYGSTRHLYVYNTADGTVEEDDRSEGQVKTKWVKTPESINEIINLEHDIETEYNKEPNLKAYLTQKFTGIKMSEKDIENKKYGFEVMCFWSLKDAKAFLANETIKNHLSQSLTDKGVGDDHFSYFEDFDMYFVMIPNRVAEKIGTDKLDVPGTVRLTEETQFKVVSKNFRFKNIPEYFDMKGKMSEQ